MMTGHDLLRVLDTLHLAGVSPVIEGGWGIDALLGQQTRPHHDLDLLVLDTDLEVSLEALSVIAFDDIRAASSTGALTVANRDGRSVDLRCYDTDYLISKTIRFDSDRFNGRGFVVGRPVRCIDADGQVMSRVGYEPASHDLGDMWKLAELARVQLAAPYTRGDSASFRTAQPNDLAALAAISHAHHATAHTGTLLANLDVGAHRRQWTRRLGLPRSWTGVAVVGGAIAAAASIVVPNRATPALLFGMVEHPSTSHRNLIVPLAARAAEVASSLGATDIQTVVAEHDTWLHERLGRLGWRPDGGNIASLDLGLLTGYRS